MVACGKGVIEMKKRISLFTLLVAGFCWAAPPEAPVRPDAFPRVELSPGSIPYYAPVYVDVDSNEVAYVLFDGNVSNGYNRLYFWIPNNPEYRTPRTLRWNDEAKRFGPVVFQPRHPQDEIRIGWSFGWGRTGGAFEHYDYLTGQVRKGTRPIHPVFRFQCDYYRRPRSGTRPADSLVDITMRGQLYASLWTNMPAPLQPWNSLNYYKTMRIVREKGEVSVLFQGRLNYGDSPCEVRALPRETVCTLVVSPYMRPPIYSNDVSWAEAFQPGIRVPLDFGWYDLYWNIASPGLNVRPRLDVAVRRSPFPVPKVDE